MRTTLGQPGRRSFTLVEMPFDKLRVVHPGQLRRVVSKWKGAAFTLVELLIVIALVGMLAAILTTALITARRASIRLECQSKMNQIGQMLQQVSMDNGTVYPMLEQKPVNGSYPLLKPPIASQAGGTPWWARVYMMTPGASMGISATGVEPPEQLPAQMQMFHCRMAPALDGSGPDAAARLTNLNTTLSYGLNYDVKGADGPYQCRADTDTLLLVGPSGDPLQYTLNDIKVPSEFILLAEADGYAAAARRVTEWRGTTATPVVGRHSGEANVLFADQHVELRRAVTDTGAGEGETGNVNADTRLWTLPAD